MKRLKYEAGGGEDDYVYKCMTCKHSYTRQDESDTLHCARRKGCKYEPIKAGEQHETVL